MPIVFFRNFAAMFKKALHKIFSSLMACLVLLSTVSFTVQKHFCGDTLIDAAIFSRAQVCGMEMVSKEKRECCKEELEVVKGQDKLKLSKFEELSFQHQVFIATLVYSFLDLFQSFDEEIIPHKNYSPPNLVTDIQVLDQIFII